MLPQWEEKKRFCSRLCSRFFSRISRRPSFLLQDRRLCAPRSSVFRSKPCKGCSPRSQSAADFIISIVVAQNGCCLEQFSLPGRLGEQPLIFCPHVNCAHCLTHTGLSCVSSHTLCYNVAPQDNAVTCVYIWWWPSTCFSRILPPKTKWRGASNQSSCQCIRVLPKPHPQST